MSDQKSCKETTICIVSPFPPPMGGMAIQAEKLKRLLSESNFSVRQVQTNQPLPLWISKLPFFRTMINLVVFIRQLNRELKQTDTVYLLTGFFNYFFWITLPALIITKLNRKKIVISARGGGAAQFFNKYGLIVKFILKRADSITTPSGFLRSVFVKSFSLKPAIVPNIADLSQFKFNRKTVFRPRLLVTRNLEEIYDVDCVIRSFKIVQDRYPNAILGIAGTGSQLEKLKQLVDKLGIGKKVIFYGEIAHKQIQKLYEEYDILVNASKIDNLPGAILEAFASGLVVISTNAGGIPFMIKNEKTGLLVDIGCCEDLAQRVITVVENPELGQAMAERGRAECQRYSWEHIKKKLIPILCAE